MFSKIISPKYYLKLISRTQQYVLILFFLFLSYGLFAGLALAPRDYQQGNVYRILYIHVPLAIGSLAIYVFMSICSAAYLIWKIKLGDLIAKISAPMGAVFTALTLITGSLWGKPTWGTYWIWDARLTSELILLFIYLSVIAVRSAILEKRLSAQSSGMITLLGMINIPIVHYSVDWWNTLHQGGSLFLFQQSTISPSMLHPLLSMIAAAVLYYVWMVMKSVGCAHAT